MKDLKTKEALQISFCRWLDQFFDDAMFTLNEWDEDEFNVSNP